MPDLDLIDHSPHHPSPCLPLANASNLILIDNYDSFTWNVYQYLMLEGATVSVYRNDTITLAELITNSPTQLVVSPGPGHPETDSGVSREAILHFAGKIPVLGVCMGQQCIISVYGGEVVFAGEILHGKTSPLLHDSKGVYESLAQELPVTRYHSLAGTHPTIPDCLEVSSWVAKEGSDEKGVIMGVRHKTYTVEGVQFHPESILTAEGRVMLRNFLAVRGGTWEENDHLRQKAQPRSEMSNGTAIDSHHPPVSGLSAYMFFAQEQHDNVKGEIPNLPFGEVERIIGERWKALNVNQRALYEAKAAADRKRYEEEMEAFNSRESQHAKKNSSILDKIYANRKAVVEIQMQIPSQRLCDLLASYNLNAAPPQISFVQRLKESPYSLSLMAEIKRASPSKGIISLSASAPEQARTYALAGASVISVLTEPEWFKGSIEDLRAVRQSLEGMPNRPAILRKEFIFDEYQILEARLAGADTVLLIVKMLEERTLSNLYRCSISLGMEPLVEVNTAEEMKIAVSLGAKVIGVNNRNLKSFEVDLGTTSRLLDLVPEGVVVCALSGISGPKDVEAYKTEGVGAVLVGEALMRAWDTAGFIQELLGGQVTKSIPAKPENAILIKICGTRTPEAAKAAVDAGADLVGVILVEGRKRCVPEETALQISKVVHETPRLLPNPPLPTPSKSAIDFFQHTSNFFRKRARALLVGVFQDQPLEYILSQQQLLGLDIVQLHGSEPIEWANYIPVPVIKSFGPGDVGLGQRGYHSLPLLDSGNGGTGKKLELESVKKTLERDPGLRVILAGGLNPNNVADILTKLGDVGEKVVGVDVSSGVEEEGQQNLEKIREFVRRAKAVKRN